MMVALAPVLGARIRLWDASAMRPVPQRSSHGVLGLDPMSVRCLQ